MKAITVLLFFSLLLVADGHSRQEPPAPSSTTQQTALVRGVLTDFLTGAGVGGATVLFESAGKTQTVVTAKDGSYEAELPIDVYRITARRMTYCSARRAAVHIGSLSETKFNFTLVPCATQEVGILSNGRYAGEETREVNPFHYDSFKVRSELLLRFGTKREDQRFIHYQGTKIKYLVWNRNSKESKDEYTYVGVMLSYDLLTVYADNIKLGKESFEIEAQGNVIVEDGSKRTRGSAVRIKLRGDKPIIEFR